MLWTLPVPIIHQKFFLAYANLVFNLFRNFKVIFNHNIYLLSCIGLDVAMQKDYLDCFETFECWNLLNKVIFEDNCKYFQKLVIFKKLYDLYYL